MTTPFEQLQKDFPVFRIKNKKNFAIGLPTASGEEIQIQPYSVAHIKSMDLIQLPDITRLHMESPSFRELMDRGMFVRTPTEPTADTPAPVPPVATTAIPDETNGAE